jgi:hypothetical protein
MKQATTGFLGQKVRLHANNLDSHLLLVPKYNLLLKEVLILAPVATYPVVK